MFSIRHLTPVRNAMRIMSAERSPRQIAGAVALGMMIGLLPKGNLVAFALTVILFSLRVNLGIGLTTIFCLSLVASWVDPLTHGLGVRVMQQPFVYNGLSSAYQLPVVPWTSLNNTVVLGALILGALLFYPVYHITESIVQRSQRAWQARRRNQTEENHPEENQTAWE